MTSPGISSSFEAVSIETCLAELEDGRKIHQGWSPQCDKSAAADNEWGVLKTTSIQAGRFEPEHNKRLPAKLSPRPHLEVRAGDILLTCAGPRHRCGVSCLVRQTRGRVMISGKMYRFRANPERIRPDYLEAFLQSETARQAIDRMKTGISDSGLNLTHGRFRQLVIPLAPIDEQQRVIAEIEKQFTRLDAGVTSLKRVQIALKRYRASVLQAACEGRLVPTEAELARKENRSYESADLLLKRILKERREKWNGKRKYKEPVGPNADAASGLQKGWTSGTVDQLASLVTDGDHNPPKRHPFGVPHLTAKNVRGWQLVTNDCTFISPADTERVFKRYRPRAGDLIVTCVGTVGRTALVPPDLEFSPDRNLAAIRPASSGISMRFLNYVLSSPRYQERMGGASGSTAQPHLYLGDLRTFEVPIPPLAEQNRIVAEVDRRMSVIDGLEEGVKYSLQRATRLRRSILQRAFTSEITSPIRGD